MVRRWKNLDIFVLNSFIIGPHGVALARLLNFPCNIVELNRCRAFELGIRQFLALPELMRSLIHRIARVNVILADPRIRSPISIGQRSISLIKIILSLIKNRPIFQPTMHIISIRSRHLSTIVPFLKISKAIARQRIFIHITIRLVINSRIFIFFVASGILDLGFRERVKRMGCESWSCVWVVIEGRRVWTWVLLEEGIAFCAISEFPLCRRRAIDATGSVRAWAWDIIVSDIDERC